MNKDLKNKLSNFLSYIIVLNISISKFFIKNEYLKVISKLRFKIKSAIHIKKESDSYNSNNFF